MVDNYKIEVRFGDDNLTPGKVRSHDIATMIRAIEQMIAAIFARNNPALHIQENQVTVGLSAVQDGSIRLRFESQYDIRSSYELATRAIVEKSFDKLPIHSIEAIKNIVSVSRAYRTETKFGYQDGDFVELASVSANTAITVDVPTIEGVTTLYGVLTSIGGISPPNATLTLMNGKRLRCNVTEKESLTVARQLGTRLYSEIGVRGTARWDLRDMSIVFFRIDELLSYKETNLTEAIEHLAELASPYFEAIDDLDTYFADLRENDGILE